MKWWRHWWIWCGAGISLVYLLVSLLGPPGFGLTLVGDIGALLLLMAGTAVMVVNAVSNRGHARAFWVLLASGLALWTINQAGWSFYEIVLRRELPDPFAGDIVLFMHVVPMMAAVALRPHHLRNEAKLYFSTLNFLMLVAWWVFLYAFIVFPDEYVVLNVAIYTHNYDLLYLMENVLLVGALGLVASGCRGSWKSVYWNFFAASAIYTAASLAINSAIARGEYYTGSAYDVPLMIALCWFIWTGLLARQICPTPDPARENEGRLATLAPRLAMIAIVSLPAMGLWAFFFGPFPHPLRTFRLMVALLAILVLSVFVFLKQYFLNQQVVRVLRETDRSFENLQRLQTQIVHQEKLASLGEMVAGAAHEINAPLAAILDHTQSLSSDKTLGPEQVSMSRKIGQQASRTRELVADLLSFAQQNPVEKSKVDMVSLLQKVVQSVTLRAESKKIHVQTRMERGLPGITGNANELLRACLEITGNAMDELEEVGGGGITISAAQDNHEIVITFSDTGRGVREPNKVFDPFYTTKPIGKGTGLGLSAAYGVVQQHQGRITCCNNPEGGASFILRLPVDQAMAGS